MFRDLYSTRGRVHSFRSPLRAYKAMPSTQAQAPDAKLSVHDACVRALDTLGNFPHERQLLLHHPLIGFEELPFIEAIELLHRLTRAQVWPSMNRVRSLLETGEIAPQDWEDACFWPPHHAAPLHEIEPDALRSAYLKSDSSLAPHRSVPSPSLAQSLDGELGTQLVASINRELTQILRDYAVVCQEENPPHSLWSYAEKRLLLRTEGSRSLCIPGTRYRWIDGPEAVLTQMLEALAIPRAEWQLFMLESFWSLPGWSSWLKAHKGQEQAGIEGLSVLALRLATERVKVQSLGRRHGFSLGWNSVHAFLHHRRAGKRNESKPSHGLRPTATFALQSLGLAAWENAWRRRCSDLIAAQPKAREAGNERGRPDFQGVFCIDPRCEPLRTAWERQDAVAIETLSTSGSFTLRPRHLAPDSYPAQEELADRILRELDWGDRYARLILICGHSHPHADPWCSSYLECTACGGFSGAAHAQHAVELLNDPHFRQKLSSQGLMLPADTIFVAGVLRTDRRAVHVLDGQRVPSSHQSDLKQLEQTLDAAARTLAHAEVNSKTVCEHSGGAIKNAGFIIGPRALTYRTDLGGRCFLHSYTSETDADATLLTRIFRGPLAMGIRINLQFYFSSVDPDRWGAGRFTDLESLHPALRLRREDGDLALGIPLDALQRGDEQHEPLRLQVFVAASEAQVHRAFRESPQIARAWRAGWFFLSLIDPVTSAIVPYQGASTPKETF